MDPLKTYDYLTRARRRILDWTRPLTPEQYTREFPIGCCTLARTLTHILISEWYYIERLQGRDVPPYAHWPIRDENPPAFPDLEAAWTEQAARTVAALRGVRDWNAAIEYRITDDDGRPMHITATASDIVTQLLLHEVHHRAQAMNILRHLGVTAEDLDYNTLMYHRRPC